MASQAESLRTATVEVTEDVAGTIIDTGGYTHPMFLANAERGEDEGRPLPGQGVLLLMGGLLEQSGILDDAIALLELKSVRFLQMVRVGAELSVGVTAGESRTTSSGRIVQEYTWTVYDGETERVAEAQAVMLLKGGDGTDHRQP